MRHNAEKMPPTPPDPVRESLSVVLNGSFNPAIFHPDWFVKHNLVGPTAVDFEQLKVVSGEITQFSVGPFAIFCTHERLQVSIASTVHAEMLLDFCVGTFQILSHIVVSSVGINHDAVYQVGSFKHWHSIGHALAPKEAVWSRLCSDPGLQLLSINSPREWSHPLVDNLSVSPVPKNDVHHPGLLCKANLHFLLPRDGSTSTTAWAIKFLNEHWPTATEKAREIGTVIFEQIPE